MAVGPQPGEIGRRGDAAVHDDHRPVGGAQGAQCRLQGCGLRDVSGKDTAAPHEAAAVQNQPERQEGRIGAPPLRMAALRLRHPGRPLETGVCQIIQGDGRSEVEQGLGGAEQMVLDPVLMRQQPVRSPVKRHVVHRREVDAEQFAGGTGRAQPACGLALRRGMRHAGDDAGQGAAALAAVEAEIVQQLRQPQQLQRRQGGMFDSDGPPVPVAHRRDVDRLVQAVICAGLVGEQPAGDSLRLGLDLRVHLLEAETLLAGPDLHDASAQQRPCVPSDGEMASEVEQGPLPDLSVDAAVFDQAMGDARRSVGCGACFCCANEHGLHHGLHCGLAQALSCRRWHYKRIPGFPAP